MDVLFGQIERLLVQILAGRGFPIGGGEGEKGLVSFRSHRGVYFLGYGGVLFYQYRGVGFKMDEEGTFLWQGYFIIVYCKF
ncbi:hypothetical protein [Spirosoma gilvum]